MRAGRRAASHDEASSRCSQFCERAPNRDFYQRHSITCPEDLNLNVSARNRIRFPRGIQLGDLSRARYV